MPPWSGIAIKQQTLSDEVLYLKEVVKQKKTENHFFELFLNLNIYVMHRVNIIVNKIVPFHY